MKINLQLDSVMACVGRKILTRRNGIRFHGLARTHLYSSGADAAYYYYCSRMRLLLLCCEAATDGTAFCRSAMIFNVQQNARRDVYARGSEKEQEQRIGAGASP